MNIFGDTGAMANLILFFEAVKPLFVNKYLYEKVTYINVGLT